MAVYSTGGVHIDKAISGKKSTKAEMPKPVKKTTKKATKKGK